MNNKTYANYLMHGRTKGSRNGISTTKGYTAVGQKAKGKLINGKYVYDTPVAYGNNTEMVRDGKVVYESPSVPTGVASYPKKKSDWAKEAASYDNHVTTYPKQGYDALMMEKRNAWLAEKAKAQGASNNWQQQAALEQWKKQNQNAIAAKKKAQALKDVANKGSQNDWQNQGARHRAAMETVRNNGAGFYEVTSDVNAYYDRKSQKAREEKAAKLPNAGASQAGNTARAMKEYMTKASADRKAKAQSAKQPTNIGASQSADLARWAQQNRNNIAAKKTADAKAQAAKDAAWNAKVQVAKKPTNIGASQAGNTARAMKEYMTKASADRKAKAQAVKDNATQMGLRNKVKAGAANNWQQQASERAALGQQRIRNENGTSGQNLFYNKNSVVKNQRFVDETPRDASGNVRVTYRPKADNTSNNWQQNANKTAGILGNMSREDRSLMKSKEWTSTDKDGTKKTNNSFNVNNKYGYSNYIKSDNGWHDIHMGEYNTTGVKGVKKQQDWNTSYERNHRSDIGNAVADAKADAKKAFKEAKADAKQAYVNLKNKFKKKKKK